MNLQIITPQNTLFSGEITLVQLPGIDGLFEILQNHAPHIAALKEGIIKIETKDFVKTIHIKGGIAETFNNNILVLAN